MMFCNSPRCVKSLQRCKFSENVVKCILEHFVLVFEFYISSRNKLMRTTLYKLKLLKNERSTHSNCIKPPYQ